VQRMNAKTAKYCNMNGSIGCACFDLEGLRRFTRF
jgi:hypothetical protein